jgi:alkanesulfonate monooxygenase SsuD/methylene tetrahydromethanopterin reductase-like flavin-dependent oxidoreductase (luciferase family)
MLKIAAQYADNWNSLGGLSYSTEEVLELTWQNNNRLTEFALTFGRDPNRIRRSFCVGFTQDSPFVSVGAFQDFIGRYMEVGITEFMLGFWRDEDAPDPVPIKHAPDEVTLEWIASKAIPGLSASWPVKT